MMNRAETKAVKELASALQEKVSRKRELESLGAEILSTVTTLKSLQNREIRVRSILADVDTRIKAALELTANQGLTPTVK